jgi:LysM repeat protein
VFAIELASGQPVTLPGSIGTAPVEVRLPLPSVPVGPGEQATWLMEVDDPATGAFLGYMPVSGTPDPTTGQLVLSLQLNQLHGTLFLPVVLHAAFVRNFDPQVHIWSSPFAGATDYGVAAPQWTRMQVLGPEVSQRLPVLNAFTGEAGWVDAAGVGPVPVDDGLPAVPAVAAAAPSTSTDVAPAAETSPDAAPRAPSPTYVVQPGDTLASIAAAMGMSVDDLLAANPGVDPNNLTSDTVLQLPMAAP